MVRLLRQVVAIVVLPLNVAVVISPARSGPGATLASMGAGARGGSDLTDHANGPRSSPSTAGGEPVIIQACTGA